MKSAVSLNVKLIGDNGFPFHLGGKMRKIVFTTFLVFGLFAFTEKIFGEGYYKWADKKGTIHFSDNRTSSVGNQEKGPPKEDAIEVLNRSETNNRPQRVAVVSDGKTIRIYGLSQTPSRSTSSQTPSRRTSSKPSSRRT